LFDVYSADEAFVTGTFAGLVPVCGVDGREIGDGRRGPMVAKLQQFYMQLLEQECASG
jgi:branched-subunit amino acid aminotransferase/4-amino-4-deoxychorismate lyase